MKTHVSDQRNHALTLVEVLVVIVVLVLSAAILLPSLARTKRGSRINCVNNLKQIGLAYRIWAGDNGDKYPMDVSMANGGTMELMNTPDAWKTFLVMSNELSTPKVLICPQDTDHFYATNFSTGFSVKNISYFIGLNNNTNSPSALLSGDDNFLNNNSSINHRLLNLATDDSPSWDASRHVSVTKQGWFSKTEIGFGNILLADGSVQMVNNSGLANLLQQTGFATNRLAIP